MSEEEYYFLSMCEDAKVARVTTAYAAGASATAVSIMEAIAARATIAREDAAIELASPIPFLCVGEMQ